jgi:hypothetical protein
MLLKLTSCVLTLRASLGRAELLREIPFRRTLRGVSSRARRVAKIAMGESWQHVQLTERILNAFMVREGLALDYAKYSREHIREEDAAREQERGMWAGAFIAPWDWRHRDRNTIILGALSVPITAQAQLLAPASSTNAPSPECTIKGNVNRRGERIYHLPGQRSYAAINMQDPQKRWFCSEEEARAAGWRPAKQ